MDENIMVSDLSGPCIFLLVSAFILASKPDKYSCLGRHALKIYVQGSLSVKAGVSQPPECIHCMSVLISCMSI
jgi:hypothetical protein